MYPRGVYVCNFAILAGVNGLLIMYVPYMYIVCMCCTGKLLKTFLELYQ